jgi:hypothetical protein
MDVDLQYNSIVSTIVNGSNKEELLYRFKNLNPNYNIPSDISVESRQCIENFFNIVDILDVSIPRFPLYTNYSDF